jgi:hypothetical protein
MISLNFASSALIYCGVGHENFVLVNQRINKISMLYSHIVKHETSHYHFDVVLRQKHPYLVVDDKEPKKKSTPKTER